MNIVFLKSGGENFSQVDMRFIIIDDSFQFLALLFGQDGLKFQDVKTCEKPLIKLK